MNESSHTYAYVREPAEIYRQSFETVRNEAALERFPEDISEIIIRLIHACGMPDIAEDIHYHPAVISSGRAALHAGAPILVDAEMVASGIIRSRLPAKNRVICTLNDPRTPAHAKTIQNTRSAAAVDFWSEHLADAIVVIGNAPTALFRLLELLHDGAPRPAAIFGFPVGFIGAAESKQALIDFQNDLRYMTLSGRRGGSAIASASINALAGGLS